MEKYTVWWWEGHKEKCEVNYQGSFRAMEVTGALRIWQQSMEKHNLRYTTIFSDGDSKTVKHLDDNKPYGGNEITNMNVWALFKSGWRRSLEH